MSEIIDIGGAEDENFSYEDGELEILDYAYIKVRVKLNGIQVISVVDNDNNPLDNKISADSLLIDEVRMDALSEYFSNNNVNFIGDPWTTPDQEDYLGSLEINCRSLNEALKSSKICITKINESGTYYFEGLDQFVKDYIDKHFDDEKYQPEESEDEEE